MRRLERSFARSAGSSGHELFAAPRDPPNLVGGEVDGRTRGVGVVGVSLPDMCLARSTTAAKAGADGGRALSQIAEKSVAGWNGTGSSFLAFVTETLNFTRKHLMGVFVWPHAQRNNERLEQRPPSLQ